ncbi:hypothetical protein K505DRAFT_405175 [Melanomma pulvis-pyrius CBS 109.77]|uniref:Uncharacterized protein n=1 Tax=Melanomma pulvis-pyrius CBS 109.77 TaxID=1314802 RepID=A0A6A6XQQ4_9PLEO|nr:hypothetical protein K505DRAFT_405175 [Melanomma pulvis-pyrius CBS 109.77]
MNSSTRLYERLGQIPQDPEDPESLEDLIVCAFGAFERYYVYGYDLPPTLKEWLFPIDGTTRDFPSLQVVFGRGDEYFASDKNGKLEKKESEIKKPPPPTEGDELLEKPAMRRSRTVSFLRPLSDPIARFNTPSSDSLSKEDPGTTGRRSQSVSSQSQPALWTPSASTSRPSSDPIIKPINAIPETYTKETLMESPVPTPTRPVRRSRPLSMSFNPGSFPKIVEGKQLISRSNSPTKDPAHCTCGCHTSTPSIPTRSNYTDSSMQTDPITPPPRTALRIDTATGSDTSSLFYSNASSALEVQTPLTDDLPAPNPVYMGRMLDYFSKPGYQLGDSLFSSYQHYQQPVYQEEYEDEEDWVADRRQTV